MTSEQAYLLFTDEVNRNFSGINITSDRQSFVAWFNVAQNRWVRNVIKSGNDDDIRFVQKLLKVDNLTDRTAGRDRDTFKLPDDYFDLSSAVGFATRGNCKNRVLHLWELKPKNRNEIMPDAYNDPSFDYEEAPYFVQGDTIAVLKDDFTVDKVEIEYYRKPVQIEMAGYIDEDGNTTTNTVNPEWNDEYTAKIVSLTAELFHKNNQNQGGVQYSKDNVVNNN